MDWTIWKGKYIFVKLRSGACYTGEVIDVEDNPDRPIFIQLNDKFGLTVAVAVVDIEKINEERNNGRRNRH